MQVVKPPTELELLQLEVAALREMVIVSKQQADAMLLALASSLLGGIGFNLLLGSANPTQSFAKGLVLLFASLPVALVGYYWLHVL